MQRDAVAGRMATVETSEVVAERSRAGWLSEGARAQIKEYAPTFLTEFAVMAVGLPRYIGFSNGRGDREAADRYFGATLWCAGGAAIVCLVLINLFPGLFSYLFFGSKSYRSLALPLSLMIVGLCEHAVA